MSKKKYNLDDFNKKDSETESTYTEDTNELSYYETTEKIEEEKAIEPKIEVIKDLKKKFDLNKISQMVVNQDDLRNYLKSINAKPSGGTINKKRVITGFWFEGKLINIRAFYK